MIRLKNFEIKKDQNINKNYLRLKKFIDSYVSQPKVIILSNDFSKIFEIPKHILDLKFKRLLYNDFTHSSYKFKSHTLFKILISFILFFSSIIYFLLLGNKNFKQQEYDLIIEIDNIRQFRKFLKIQKKYKKTIIFTNNKEVCEESKKLNQNSILYDKLKFNNNILLGKIKNLIYFAYKSLKISIETKENLLEFYLKAFLSIIKNESLFSQFKSDVILQDRFYINCPIKNFIFKKFGGKKILCCQYHLASSDLCFYSDMDILLTFGNEKNTLKKLRVFGSRVEESFPVGSLQMENEFYTQKNYQEQKKKIDLLIIGINPSQWLDVSNKIYKNYYVYLNWIVKFEKEYPLVNILYKHHASFKGDVKEDKIFNNSKIQIMRKGNSYQYLKKCKVAISYGSTMIIEGLSLKKNFFFVDPQSCASNFYSHHKFDKCLFLNTYKNFSSSILRSLKFKSKIIHKSDRYCLESSKVSQKVYSVINKIKNNKLLI